MTKSLALIHSPLVGPLTWRATAAALGERGHRACVPSLAGLVEQGPPYHRRLAGAVAASIRDLEGARPVALVVHSGAGGLVPSITALSERPLSAVLFVDAILPHPGESRMQRDPAPRCEGIRKLAREGWLPPWHEWFPAGALAEILPNATLREGFIAELRPIPLDYFAEAAPAVPGWPQAPCAYLQLSQAYDRQAGEAERRGWPVHRLMSDHLAMLTRPGEVAEALLLLLRKLDESSRRQG